MNKKDNLKLSILAAISLTALILILLFLCYRLIISIMHTFVYLIGLTTILLVIIFYLAVIVFCIRKLYKRYKSCKRSQLTLTQTLNIIVKTEVIITIELALLYISLYIINLFI